MKSEKGITVMSVIMYVVLLIVVLGIFITVIANIKSGINDSSQKGTEILEINKFNMYFLQEVKKQGNNIESISPDKSEILFNTGNKYVYINNNNGIYLKQAPTDMGKKIAQDIMKCEFSKETINGKTIVKVTIQAKNTDEKTIKYVLNENQLIPNYEDENSYISTTE